MRELLNQQALLIDRGLLHEASSAILWEDGEFYSEQWDSLCEVKWTDDARQAVIRAVKGYYVQS